ncbi:hypothetical protein D3093_30060 (plasmid) [Azospirillum argentinense]|uniref:Uncharacterized protein n=1 Tax=Azospirillum argentinense TaxID=2970906 RepID=A0A4D8PQD4_9PROT|nr:hypothetical protein [Azospirillum argentinense]QCN99470.1 hypothetical protein D3093_30060 [Azospirillum argentinense]
MTTVPPGLTPHILPGILREIAEIAGFQAAVDLCVAARGRRFYIPARSRLTKNHPLVLAVGWRAARLIADAYGHETLPIPTARPVLRAYRARVLRTAGYTTGQIAMILDMERGNVLRLAPASDYPIGPVDPRVLRAIFDDAPRRFARMKPGAAQPAPVGEQAPLPLFAHAGVQLPL